MTTIRAMASLLLSAACVVPTAAAAGSYVQNRAMGGAAAAAVADNSSIVVNPAGMGQLLRYTVGMMWAHEPGGWDMGASIVDSHSTSLAMGVDWRYRRPSRSGTRPFHIANDLTIGIGEAYEGIMFVGLSYHLSAWKPSVQKGYDMGHNAGAGVIVPAGDHLRFGLAVHDVLPFSPGLDYRPNGDLGLAVAAAGGILTITLDGIWYWDEGQLGQVWDVVAGVEAIALEEIGLRLGSRTNVVTGDHTLSAGAGWFFPRGHVGYAYELAPNGGGPSHVVSLEILTF